MGGFMSIEENTRSVAKEFIRRLEAKQVADAYSLIGQSGRFILIGTTPISGVFDGWDEFIAHMGPILADLPDPTQLTFSETIVEGDRAVILASGKGKALGGQDYSQPYYAFVARVEGSNFSELIEFCDTVLIERAYFGKSIVNA
jgi:ketosteroid isomerase-like protein